MSRTVNATKRKRREITPFANPMFLLFTNQFPIKLNELKCRTLYVCTHSDTDIVCRCTSIQQSANGGESIGEAHKCVIFVIRILRIVSIHSNRFMLLLLLLTMIVSHYMPQYSTIIPWFATTTTATNTFIYENHGNSLKSHCTLYAKDILTHVLSPSLLLSSCRMLSMFCLRHWRWGQK